MVQFAEGRHDRCEYAVKFFLEPTAFHAETALFASCTATPLHGHRTQSDGMHADGVHAPCIGQTSRQSLPAVPAGGPTADSDDLAVSVPVGTVARGPARFLPRVEVVCEGGGDLVDGKGRPLPPCIVMEKGESLHDWSERASPDMFTALAVRTSACTARVIDRSCRFH